MRGSISELVPDGFGRITDQDGREYFFHRGALMGVDFDDLAPGPTWSSWPARPRAATSQASTCAPSASA